MAILRIEVRIATSPHTPEGECVRDQALPHEVQFQAGR